MKHVISFWKDSQQQGEFDLPQMWSMEAVDKIAEDNKIEWDAYYVIKYTDDGILVRRESLEQHRKNEGPHGYKETLRFLKN